MASGKKRILVPESLINSVSATTS